MATPKVKQAAFTAARAAGSLIKQRLGKIESIDYKGAFNIVTDVDRDSERTIVNILSHEFPGSSFLTEEGGALSGSQHRWLIDPIDGTTNYTHAYPFFSVSIASEEAGIVTFGLVYNPISEELFWAEKGQGAWLNDKSIRVSAVSSLSSSLLATGFPPDTAKKKDNNLIQFAALTHMSHGVRRDGSAALDLCFVASGRLDGFWEMKLAPWDTAAGSLIVAEAGGKVSDLFGGPFEINSGYILATNAVIHDEIIAVFNRLKDEPTLLNDIDKRRVKSN